MIMKSVAFPFPFWHEIHKHVKNKPGWIQNSLNFPPGAILCFCLSFLSHLCSFCSGSYTGCANSVKDGPQQMSPEHVAYYNCPYNFPHLRAFGHVSVIGLLRMSSTLHGKVLTCVPNCQNNFPKIIPGIYKEELNTPASHFFISAT